MHPENAKTRDCEGNTEIQCSDISIYSFPHIFNSTFTTHRPLWATHSYDPWHIKDEKATADRANPNH